MWQRVVELVRHRSFITLAIGGLIVGVGGAVVVATRPQADRLTPVASLEPSGQQTTLMNAPSDVQACFAERASASLAVELLTDDRPLTEAEQATLNSCFRDVTVPADRHESATAIDRSAPATTTSTPAITSSTANTPPRSTPTAPAASEPSSSSGPPPKVASPLDDVHAEVWTKNGYDGASYEYKVNCGPNHATLEECFLWDLTRVTVTAPSGTVYELAKDFNRNSYSGEVTRRWVLYGPAGGGLPSAGQYVFRYYQGDTVKEQAAVDYTPEVVDPPSAVSYERTGDNDVVIRWQAPAGISSRMWYKPSVDPPGNDRQIISQTVAWDQTSATLNDITISAGETIEINVAVFFRGGYAYPKPLTIVW